MSDSIGVAIVGLGVGEQHARAIAQRPDCELRWLYDTDNHKAQRLQAQLQQGKVAQTLQQCLDDEHVGILVIASYDHAHYEQVLLALQCHKHVFVEKPLCQALSQAQAIKSAWLQHRGKLKLGSNVILRAAPIFRWLKTQINDDVLGDIYALDADYLYGRFEKITSGWRGRNPHYSVMQGGGIHMVDLMLWLTQQRPQCVSSVGNRIAAAQWESHTGQHLAFQGPDYVSSRFIFNNNMIATINANFACVHPHQHVLRIFGTRGSFLLDDQGARLHSGRDHKPRITRPEFAMLPLTKTALLDEFIDAVKKDYDLNAHTQELLNGICVCAAANQALQLQFQGQDQSQQQQQQHQPHNIEYV